MANITTNTLKIGDNNLVLRDADAQAKIATLEADTNTLKEDLSQKFYTTIGKNLANTEGAEVGLLMSNGRLDPAGSGALYRTSGLIEIESNTVYSYCVFNNNAYHEVNNSTRKTLLLYNSSKEPVASSYISQTNVANVTFDSSTEYKYVRICYDATKLPQLEAGAEHTNYAEYTEKDNLATYLGNAAMGQINSIYGDFIRHIPIDLHDASTDVVGVLSGGNVDPTGTNYKTSDYISIKSGYKYVFAHPRNICIYDIEKYYERMIQNSSNAEYVFTPETDCLIRFSYLSSQTDSSVVCTYDGEYSFKIDERVDLSLRQVATIEELIATKNADPLYGKKWVVCGDSFTNDGGTGTKITDGKYIGKSFTYPWIIGNRHNMDIVKFFEGGRTLAFPATPGTFTNSLTNPNASWYYQNFPADADYITIYLGINDEHHAPNSSGGDGEDNTGEIPIGTVNDDTTATYLGAWNVVLTWLVTNRPNAHIGIIVTNGIAGKDEYRQGQIAIATKYGIPYIDMNGDARTPAMLRTSNPNIPTAIKQALIAKWAVDPTGAGGTVNIHPNDAAQLFESAFIENFLKSI